MGDISYTYDLQNRLTNLQTLSGNFVNYSYDNQGRRSKVQYPNGITTKLSFNENSQLLKISHEKNNSNLLSYSYEHDQNGNRTQMNVSSPVAEALSQVNYTYDSVNQLLSATKTVQSNTNESFVYDNLGNRLKKNNQATNNVYDNNNRIVSDETFNYAHDDNGNMIKKVNRTSGYTTRYTWDFENKLQFVKEYSSENATTPIKTHTFLYDVYGRRILKDSNGIVHKYIYDNEDILFEFDNGDNLVSSFTHGLGIDEPVEIIQNNQNYYYHVDGLGSITGISNTNGEIVQSYAYSSFGETKVYDQSGSLIDPSLMVIKSPYGYTSREFDFEIGLNFHQARYYDPRIGRFISEDSQGFYGQDSNLYRYVKNNSIIYNDPNGNFAHLAVGAFIGGTFGGISAYLGGARGWDLARAMAVGAGSGALSSIPGVGFFYGSLIGGSSNLLLQFLSGKSADCIDYTSVLVSAFAGGLGANLGNLASKYLNLPPNVIGNNLGKISSALKDSNNMISAIVSGITAGFADLFGNNLIEAN